MLIVMLYSCVVARIVRWICWARVIRGRRLPAIGRPNAEILHHGPPPAYARGQAAVGRGGAVAAGAPRHSAWGAPAAVVSEEVALIAKLLVPSSLSPFCSVVRWKPGGYANPVLV
jgi:hypothetical protein